MKDKITNKFNFQSFKLKMYNLDKKTLKQCDKHLSVTQTETLGYLRCNLNADTTKTEHAV